MKRYNLKLYDKNKLVCQSVKIDSVELMSLYINSIVDHIKRNNINVCEIRLISDDTGFTILSMNIEKKVIRYEVTYDRKEVKRISIKIGESGVLLLESIPININTELNK